jgi:transmembrane sensor
MSSPVRIVAQTAADWIQRRQFWNWSKVDQAELDAWLAENPLHLVTYLRLEAAWARTERLVALNRPLSETPRVASESRNRWFPVRAAAVLIASGVAAGGLWFAQQPRESTYTTPIGVHETISLADGSQIELNTDSALRTRVDGNRRVAILDRGEALFKIKHDAAHPFVVIAGDHRVTDIGTQFMVREQGARVEVAVLEGSARLDSVNARSATLKAGDMAVVSSHSLVVTKKPQREIANSLAWQRGMLVFSQTPLADVAAELNRYNTKKLVIADADAARARIGGTFPTSGVEEVTAAARVLFGLHVEERGNEIVISR